MSTDKIYKIADILHNLRHAKKFDNWKTVAEYLGVSEGVISAWKTRNSQSAVEKILYRCRGDVLERYILTGEGPVSPDDHPTIQTGTKGDLLQAIEKERQAGNLVSKTEDEKGNVYAIYKELPAYHVPIISWTQAGDWADIEDQYPMGRAEHFAYCPPDKFNANVFALVVRGDSMEPRFLDGDIVVIDPNRQPVTGDYVVAKTTNGNNDAGEATLKQFYQDIGTVLLRPLNDKYPTRDMTGVDFRIVGVVVFAGKGF